MKQKIPKTITIILATLLSLSILVQSIPIENAEATPPPAPPVSWTGHGAMAHWDLITENNVSITMDVTYKQRLSTGESDMINIKVLHAENLSEATGYTVNFTDGPVWSMDHVFINATLTFNWKTGYSAHPIAIDWRTSPPSVSNEITWQNGSVSYMPGEWRSGNDTKAYATMVIGGTGPHPSNYTSSWAAVGQTPTFPPTTNWTGQGAMAHWSVIDTDNGNVPIEIDAVYGQQTRDGSGSNMIYIKVIHPEGVSEVTGYTANMTNEPIWGMDRVFINTTLAFNWTGSEALHPITIEWLASSPATTNSITWQNGSTGYLPGQWRSGSGNNVNATIIIGGRGHHPLNYTSDWAAVGQTPTFPAPTNWTGNGAMAHWDIFDAESNVPISIDAVYGQQSRDGTGNANLVYIKVIHPQGTSEATGYTANITSGPTWNMNHVIVNATLTFNWKNGYSAHPIFIEWYTSGPAVSNNITWQNGTTKCVPGEWISGNGNTANATMIIGGTGPHPRNYTSSWAAVGQTPTFPAPNWTGNGAMAHWDIIDTTRDNAMISMDAYVAQNPNDDSRTNVLWVRVIHPQGVSEATGYSANMTSGPMWITGQVSLNATLTFNWTSGNLPHPIAIEWSSTAPSVNDVITWQNGSTTIVNGTWRTATATMTIGGQGPHPNNYISDWAVMGSMSALPTPTPTPTASPTTTPTPEPTKTPTPTPTPTGGTTVSARTDTGGIVVLKINGNIATSQMSNVRISWNQSSTTTTLSFTLTGASGTTGFGNITIPKSGVLYGTIPTVYIDGARVQDQGYAEDSNNYYVWYSVHFSSHEVRVVFASSLPIMGLPPEIFYAVAVILAVILVAIVAVIVRKLRKKAE